MSEGAAHVDRNSTSRLYLALSCLAIGLGGVLLGIQIDGNGDWVGTGYTSLGIGALVALVATLTQAGSTGNVPRTPILALSAAMGFFGLAFIISGVLAPGGVLMFFEVFLLIWLLSRKRSSEQSGWPEISISGFVLVSLMLIFRVWITYQGSRHEWAVMSVDIPVLSWFKASWLDPIKTLSLGSFTPRELGFPAAGIDFPLTMSLWALGFVLSAAGLWLKSHASREFENDRIHALISTLPPGIANMVEKLLPEEEWEALELHGLPERRLARRIETLLGDRVARQRQFRAAYESERTLLDDSSGGFGQGVREALVRYDESVR